MTRLALTRMTILLALLAGVAANSPDAARAQSASYSKQNGVIFWHGNQQRTAAPHSFSEGTSPRSGNDAPASSRIAQYGAPGFLQHPASGRPALGRADSGGTRSQPQLGGSSTSTATGNTASPAPYLQQYPGYGYSGYGYPGYGVGQAASGPQAQNLTAQELANQQFEQQQPAQQPQNQQQQAGDPRLTQQRPEYDPTDPRTLSPEAAQFFQNLRGPNISTWNQNRGNYSFAGQTRPSTTIPGITWQSGSRFGQSYTQPSFYNQSLYNQNQSNYSLYGISTPGFPGWR
jgi:hypothetical protein